ncbi:MAG: AAA-associated domain-containing protein [Chloroflexota bacterium]|nr:AAA-associated domain-containing protein [Dehalococcoidia bacterium]MDW8254274.1 AAA-associated domain-containing protein [Chloroflexota bacterium]
MKSSVRLERWREIVERKGLDLRRPLNIVTASDIKAITGEEPRLMAKIDRREDLPAVFAEAGVFLLPIANGEYAIVRGEGYHDLEPIPEPPALFVSRLPFPLASAGAGASETQHIDFAFNSGLIERFAGLGSLYLTIRGRKRAPEFEFRLGGLTLRAGNVQVEIDAGFEGERHIVVLEGKIGARDTFHIRQLYYPFRFWSTLVPEKTVVPIFFTYQPEKQLSSFWEYRFADPFDYGSIELVRAQSFVIRPADRNVLEPRTLRRVGGPSLGPNVIPQANDMTKIMELPFRVAEGQTTVAALARAFEFDERQSRYYREAGEALGLIWARNGKIGLTDTGREFVSLPAQGRNELLFRQIFRLPLFYELLIELFLDPDKSLAQSQVMATIERLSCYRGDTLRRRAQTVLAWLRWAERATGAVRVDGTTIRLITPALLTEEKTPGR